MSSPSKNMQKKISTLFKNILIFLTLLLIVPNILSINILTIKYFNRQYQKED